MVSSSRIVEPTASNDPSGNITGRKLVKRPRNFVGVISETMAASTGLKPARPVPVMKRKLKMETGPHAKAVSPVNTENDSKVPWKAKRRPLMSAIGPQKYCPTTPPHRAAEMISPLIIGSM